MPPSTIETNGRRRPALAYIGLGANIGDPRAALDAAFIALASLPGTRLIAASSIYRSAPVDAQGPDFLNAVVVLATDLLPHALLAEMLHIERGHGRERPYRNAPRTLDLDLLLYGDHHIATPELTVPHPRAHQRAFVLRPLAEVAPQLVFPGHKPIAAMLESVADQRIDKLP